MPSCSNFSGAWTPGRMRWLLLMMAAGSITCRRPTSARWPRRVTPMELTQSRRPCRCLRAPEIRSMTKRYTFCLGLLLLAATTAFAQQNPPAAQPPAATQSPPATQGVPWSSLSGEQQKLLGRFGGNWSSLPPERQMALARGSERWLGMSPEQRGQAQKRYQQFQALPPQQRRDLRDRWEKFQSLPPNEQAAVRQNFHRFQDLPPERRQMLRQRWKNASPAERKQMVQHVREQRSRRMEMRAPPAPRPRH